MHWRIWIAIAAASGLAAVSGDAAARHLFAGDAYRIDLVSTASRYGLLHAGALIGVAALAPRLGGMWIPIAGWCFTAGMILFCGSLYLLAFAASALAARATPVGGLLLIAGWAALLLAALAPKKAE
jgi:uncharacterized membrane protein YgdD (TMEM256/DUF423 family)